MIDMDFVAVEFESLVPRGVCEYKHANTRFSDEELRRKAGVRVVRALGEMAGIPAWIAVYNPANWAFRVVPLNAGAEALFGAERVLTEADYVARIYELRAAEIPDDVAEGLNRSFLPVE